MAQIKSIKEIRTSFIEFYKNLDHAVVPSELLQAKDDPTLLFVNSGMVPFKNCFTGEEIRDYVRATSCQKCLRVSGKHNDYSQIGITPRHHTFFEMLGNFSFGDYFKEDAIKSAWRYITEVLELDKNKLWVTIHKNDQEAGDLWTQLTDHNPERIVPLGDEANLWAMGEFGPNGYSSEIFYYMGDDPNSQSLEEFLKDDGTYLEIWNLVFMQFNKLEDGSQIALPKKCIDTGMGIERIASVVQGVKSNFDTEYLRGIIAKIEQISDKSYGGSVYNVPLAGCNAQYKYDVAMRIIADHGRAITFLIADGIVPSNDGEGYVLRRFLRRAIRYGKLVGIEDMFLNRITDEVITQMGEFYPEIVASKPMIDRLVKIEEEQFRATLNNGLKLLDRHIADMNRGDRFSGEAAFKLYDTYGFPIDLTEEILAERNIELNMDEFNASMEKQKNRSRGSRKSDAKTETLVLDDIAPTKFVGYDADSSASNLLYINNNSGADTIDLVFDETPFYAEKGGQVGDQGTINIAGATLRVVDTQELPSGQVLHSAQLVAGQVDAICVGQSGELAVNMDRRDRIARHHSGTHLLNAALRNILGTHVEQRGSLVNEQKLRFDFSHFEAPKPEQLQQIEDYVNRCITANDTVSVVELPIEEAKAVGALATFGEKYGSHVRVVKMGPSQELCGGTHVTRTGDIGMFLIASEGSISSGVRRIEALTGEAALEYVRDQRSILRSVLSKLKTTEDIILGAVDDMLSQNQELRNRIKRQDNEIAGHLADKLVGNAVTIGLVPIIAEAVSVSGRDALMSVADNVVGKLQSGIVAIGNKKDGMVIIKVSKDLTDTYNANKIVKSIIEESNAGKGGGRPDMASLAGISQDKFALILEMVKTKVER